MEMAYSADSNKRTVWNNRAGYYIGLFGYYIKNYFLFNKFWKNPKKKIIVHARLFECAEYWIHFLGENAQKNKNIFHETPSNVWPMLQSIIGTLQKTKEKNLQ